MKINPKVRWREEEFGCVVFFRGKRISLFGLNAEFWKKLVETENLKETFKYFKRKGMSKEEMEKTFKPVFRFLALAGIVEIEGLEPIEEILEISSKTGVKDKREVIPRKPYVVGIELTSRCNHRCIFCYNVWKGPVSQHLTELSFSKVKELVDRLVEEEIYNVNLTGGEPTLRDDFMKIAHYILVEKGLWAGMVTNGTLLNGEKVEKLASYGIGRIQFSIHTLNREKYKIMTGSNALEKVLKNVKYAIDCNIKVGINTTLTKLNYRDYPEILEFAAKLGVDNCAPTIFMPVGEGFKNLEHLSLSSKEIDWLLNIIDEKVNEYGLNFGFASPVFFCMTSLRDIVKKYGGKCDGGINWCMIGPDGSIRLCDSSRVVLGNIFYDSIEKIWKEHPYLQKHRNFETLPEKCKKCAFLMECRSCTALWEWDNNHSYGSR